MLSKLISSHSQGFSLIEVIVAVTVLSLMTLGLYSLVDNGQRTKESVISEDQDFLQGQTALSRLQSDIEQIWSPIYYSPPPSLLSKRQSNKTRPLLTTHFPRASAKGHLIPLLKNEDKSSFSFLSTSNRRKIQDQKQGHFAWIQYSIEKDDSAFSDSENSPEGELLQLVRRLKAHDLYGSDWDFSDVQGQVLVRGVKSFAFKFWDSQKKEWQESLKELPLEDQQAPKGIQVTLVWQDKSQQEYQSTRVFRPLWPYFKANKNRKGAGL